ncbi:hypothetical protein BGZ94_010135 [Podila epigama]|nr:hypothetical protein BGZ94_010135 [Podila epigama]
MFKNTFVSGFLSVFYSLGSDPLQLWQKRVGPVPTKDSKHSKGDHDNDVTQEASEAKDTRIQDPHIEFVVDETLNSLVLELMSPHLASTFITTPSLATRTLGIKLPFLVFLVKNLGKYWSFETSTRVKPYITTMPLRMDPGWNQIQLNLADYTKRAYGTTYSETLRITLHANCRLRRVYFSDQLVPESELPAEFKLYLPVVKE